MITGKLVAKIQRRESGAPIEVYQWDDGGVEIDFSLEERMTRRQAKRLAEVLMKVATGKITL